MEAQRRLMQGNFWDMRWMKRRRVIVCIAALLMTCTVALGYHLCSLPFLSSESCWLLGFHPDSTEGESEAVATMELQILAANETRLELQDAERIRKACANFSGLEGYKSDRGFIPLPGNRTEMPDQCWSRKERALFRPTPEIQPSPALMRAIRRYESLHYNCTDSVIWTEAYQGTPPPANGVDGPLCQYVVFSTRRAGPVGLGNRIMGLLGAFFYGLLTDRVLLVDTHDWDLMRSLFCNPFPDSSWWTPLTPEQHLDLTNKPDANTYTMHASDPAFDRRYATFSYGVHSFYCGHTQSLLSRATWVEFSICLYVVPAMLYYPVFRDRAKCLFPDNEVATHLAGYLLYPSNEVWAKIRIAARARLQPAHSRVGLQIRDFSGYNSEFSRRARVCMEAFGSLPPAYSDEEWVQQMNLPLPHEPRAPPNITLLLVAALHEQYALDMRYVYEGRMVGDTSVVSVDMESHGEQEEHSLAQTKSAMVEMWLLSFSHTLVISFMSSFGYVAAILSGRRPIYLNIVTRGDFGNSWETNGRPICERAITIEPCMHIDPQQTCPMDTYFVGYTRETAPGYYVAVRPCRDVINGLALAHEPYPDHVEAVGNDGKFQKLSIV